MRRDPFAALRMKRHSQSSTTLPSDVTRVTDVTEGRNGQQSRASGALRAVTSEAAADVTDVTGHGSAVAPMPVTSVTRSAPRDVTGELEQKRRVALDSRRPVTSVTHVTSPNHAVWDSEDWQAYFDERAGIAEFEGGLARDAAEVRAFETCVCEWLNRNPAPSRPGRCAWCDKPECAGATILPFGIEQSGHTWLHDGCWADWHLERRAQATAALLAMGIEAPAGSPDDLNTVGDV
jgi:hypothetical protein